MKASDRLSIGMTIGGISLIAAFLLLFSGQALIGLIVAIGGLTTFKLIERGVIKW